MMQGEPAIKPDIHLTDAAMKRMGEQSLKQGCAGIRLAVKEAGCSGMEYVVDFSDAPNAGDFVLPFDGFSLYVDARSYEKALKGLTVDFQQDALSSGFMFINPNKKGECGCGVSFSV
ncbi:MAG: iron-sulfur cluster assembly accessory protein [Mariprofundaceae bacterium]|nr:iron-sulfur cluster assembly accessory protein [Mariprofundaceae bacterium]